MFANPRSPFTFASFPLPPIVFDEVFAGTQNNNLVNPMEDDQSCVWRSSSTRNTSLSDTRYHWNNVQLNPSSATNGTYIQVPCNHSWSNSNMNLAADVLPKATEGRSGTHTRSAPFFSYEAGWNVPHVDRHPPVLHRTFASASFDSNKQLPFHLIAEGTPGICVSLPNKSSRVPPPLREVTYGFPAYPSNLNVSEPPIPLYLPLDQSSCSPSLNQGAHPDSNFLAHRPRHRDYTALVCHRRPARAIEYDGRWMDEAELLQGVTEPGGNISVHRCRWKEDLSPCHLWIKGDKSCINIHIQKWHGGKSGGDKLRTICHWSGCGAVMLKDSIPRHILSVHLGEAWKCKGCGKEIVRNDAYRRHVAGSDVEACKTSGAVITYFNAEVVDSREALNSGGKLRYAGV